jgi:hypothetical protein
LKKLDTVAAVAVDVVFFFVLVALVLLLASAFRFLGVEDILRERSSDVLGEYTALSEVQCGSLGRHLGTRMGKTR